MAPPQLSVIDLSSKSLNSTPSSWITTCNEVMRALEEHGVFIAMYDGIPQELEDRIFLAAQDLFDLPIEVKVTNTSDKPYQAYIGPFPTSPLYESLGIENATNEEGVEKFTKLMWPSGNESFSTSALMYSKALAKLEQIVLHMVMKSYGMEDQYDSFLGSINHVLRFQKYLCPQEGKPSGLHPHIDMSFLTILHQKEVKGLEIKTKDGEWIEVDPLPSSFIVMTGEVCTAWTKGRIEAPLHGVRVQENKERFSLGLFAFIKDLNLLPSLTH